jgi:hypothetical protein
MKKQAVSYVLEGEETFNYVGEIVGVLVAFMVYLFAGIYCIGLIVENCR